MVYILGHGELGVLLAAGWVVGIPLGLAAWSRARRVCEVGSDTSRKSARTFAWATIFVSALLCGALVYSDRAWMIGKPVAALLSAIANSLPGLAIAFGPGVALGFSALRILGRANRTAASLMCRRCGYDLTGNTSGNCPECGVAIQED